MASNYPAGVTTADLPGWRRYGPATDQVDCSSCGDDDLLPYKQLDYKGRVVCSRCCPSCEVCGEWMTDQSRLTMGETTDYAGWKGHASCVASAVISRLASPENTLCAEEWMTREQIAGLFALSVEVAGIVFTDSGIPYQQHTKDSDCSVNPEDLCCSVCGVEHGCPCVVCDGRGFHMPDCEVSR